MGRIFETRKATMFARWDKMSKAFARIGKEIAIAVKAGGASPENNPGLRRVIQNARAVNMPKEKVEAATNNPTRTVANVRSAFTKNGGNLGATGSVAFAFRRMGVFRLNPVGLDADALELDLIDHGLEEMGESVGEKGDAQLVVRCGFADFGRLQKAIEERKIVPISAESEYIPMTPVQLPEAQAREVLEMIDRLEQDEDVQKVFHNLA